MAAAALLPQGALPNPDAALAEIVRRLAADGGLAALPGSWAGAELFRALQLGLPETAFALLGEGGASTPPPKQLREALRTLAEASPIGGAAALGLLLSRLLPPDAPLPNWPSPLHAALHAVGRRRLWLAPGTLSLLATPEALAARDDKGRTALHIVAAGLYADFYVCWVCTVQVAREFVARGAHLAARDASGATPLLLLCQRVGQGALLAEEGELVPLLVNSETAELTGGLGGCEETPLQAAGRCGRECSARCGHPEVAACLALWGAAGALDAAWQALPALLARHDPGSAAQLLLALRLAGLPASLPPLADAGALRLLAAPALSLLMQQECRLLTRSTLLRALRALPMPGGLAGLAPFADASSRRQLRALLLCLKRWERAGKGLVPDPAVEKICLLLVLAAKRFPHYECLLA